MRKRSLFLVLCALLLSMHVAEAAPRDAISVLNRCGNPLKGDTTIFEHTVAGGRRILAYERGTLNFDRVANDGWTFTYGSHRKKDHLNAEEMAKYMPCLTDALAASAEPEPLVKFTPVKRVEVSVKRDFKQIILYSIGLLVVIGLALFAFSRREKEEELD